MDKSRMGMIAWYPFKKNATILEINPSGEHITKEILGIKSYAIITPDALANKKYDNIFLVDPGNEINYYNMLKIKKALSSRGRLLIAFENPLGLRYWCGEPSPITGNIFDSITGMDAQKSRVDFENLLSQLGFLQKWYYLLPDHWNCREVFSDGILPDASLNARFSTYDKTLGQKLLYERALYPQIIRNKAFPFFANAYFVECRLQGLSCDVGYAALTAYRSKGHRNATIVNTNKSKVVKKPIDIESVQCLNIIVANHIELNKRGIKTIPFCVKNNQGVMPFVNNKTLLAYWIQQFEEIDFNIDEITKKLDKLYFNTILRSSDILPAGTAGNHVALGAIMKKAYLELIPSNCFYNPNNNEYTFFDQEFVMDNAPASIIIYRAINDIFSPMSPLCKYDIDGQVKKILFKRYGLHDIIHLLHAFESAFFNNIFDVIPNLAYRVRERSLR